MTRYTKTILMYTIIASAVLLCAGSASAWYTGYDYRIPVQINNTGGGAALAYQIDVPPTGVNNTSLRVVDDTTNAPIPHWCETVVGGNCTSLWFTPTTLPAGVWMNDTYYIYYGNTAATDASDYDTTFTKTYNTTGLVLELHMDEGTGNSVAADTSGCGNNGTLTNMNITGDPTSGWQGMDGGQWGDRSDMVFAAGDYLRFDGSDDYLDCGAGSGLNITGNITIVSWIRCNTSGSYERVCFKSYRATSGNRGGYGMQIRHTGEIQAEFYNDAAYYVHSSTSVTDSCWHQVATTFVPGQPAKLYVDGAEEVVTSSGTAPTSIKPVPQPFEVARLYTSGNYYYGNVCIDEMRIYDRVLTGDEIARQYIRSKYHTPPPSTSFGDVEEPTPIPVPTSDLSGWQGVGQDSAEGFGGFVSIIGVCVMLFVVGGIIIGARTMIGEVSPVTTMGIAIAIAIGALLLIMMIDIAPPTMAPMESIIMENATNATGGT